MFHPLRLALLVVVAMALPVRAADPAPSEPETVKAAPTGPAEGAADKTAPKQAPKADWTPGTDTSVVYKYDPVAQKYSVVDRSSIKKDRVYFRYSPRLGRWVWSKADAGGVLRYAFGPGSAQPAALFDMPESTAERVKALEKQAPELAKRLAISGAKPTLRLGADGRWTLMPDASKGRVFDMETGQRWEWHGRRPTPVTHGPGLDRWAIAPGRYVPVGGEPRFSIPPSYDH